LLHTCRKPNADLVKVRFDTRQTALRLLHFVNNGLIFECTSDEETEAFSVTYEETVMCFCFCMTAWIDGTTSAAIYGCEQKQFNAHCCSKCNNWFHMYCLKMLNIKPPKRSSDFLCSICEIPETPRWHHNKFVNTCSVDNFLTVLFIYCIQHTTFLSDCLGDSEFEKCIKAGIQLMLNKNVTEGKSIILTYLQSRQDLLYTNGKCDFYGSEYEKVLTFLKHVWQIEIKQKCQSVHCPSHRAEVSRHVTGFTIHADAQETIEQQLQRQFSNFGGYCGARFSGNAPLNAKARINDSYQIETNTRQSYYECTGELTITSANFVSSKPWVVPIQIETFTRLNCQNLPRQILIYGIHYSLGGYSVYIPGHFMAVINWHGQDFVYDGLRISREDRFFSMQAHDHFQFNAGGYAYYFRNDIS
jgi:hypothetical protein